MLKKRKKSAKLNSRFVFRIYILKIICIAAFFILAMGLYQVQITYSERYAAFLGTIVTANLHEDVPRGLILDRNLEILVDNTPVNIITYRHSPTVSRENMRAVASQLAELIEIEDLSTRLTPRDLRDLFIVTFPDDARALISDEERLDLTNEEFYLLQLERIEDTHLEMLTEHDKKTHAIFNNMNQGTGATTNIIKSGATAEEVAIVSERLRQLPGVGVGVDWERIYPSQLGRLPIFGNISDYERGIPLERYHYFRALGYQANARVGLSQLEMVYESLLSGHKHQYLLENDIATLMVEGQPGFHLSLTLDAELQYRINEMVERELLNARRNGGVTTRHLREAYIVMTNPHTGEILAMVGKVITEDDDGHLIVVDNPLGTFQSSFTVGSSIKAATLLAGYNDGVTQIGTRRLDNELSFAYGRTRISSWMNMGDINDLVALQKSSNIYFVRQTLELAGIPRFSGGRIPDLTYFDLGIWDYYRHFFAQFGLGTRTGIDLPRESIGMRYPERTITNLLFLSIGQADTYTTMQLAQFASTLATNGKRFELQLVRDVFLPSSNPNETQLLHGFTPNLLNVIPMNQQYFNRVHEGHRMALQERDGTGYYEFSNARFDFDPAGKTGTAEVWLHCEDGFPVFHHNSPVYVHNRTLIAYAPFDNPEIAIAVIVPQNELRGSSNPLSLIIGREAMEIYFNLQKERAE